ncbi:MAG: dihydroorotase [Paracoccaceae bacterium]|nr:dihydroorotase [Paracoccaceae bacterium]MDA0318682.1 dihydroorotase [Pseudomonadota bacterium]MDA0849796.1 dihydroorotase [Pseudomonadota bacterium]MDA1295727.1 dihydroorotase [Pseudomonadota bacterium]NCW15212.1 dihydroorotase [Paracoccaceae bacterium]
MSTVFLQNAHLIDPENGTVDQGNLLIKEGVIAARGAVVSAPGKETRIIDCAGKYLAPGIIDIGVKVCEPGERHKESFKSAGLAAAAGGITTIVTRPDTVPAIDTPETLEFIRRRAMDASIVNVLPMAALTKRREGREMTEIGFLQDAGAVGFTDCDRVVRDVKVLTRALSYARSLGAWVMGHPQDPYLSEGAAVTSGKFATLRGLPGVSPLAERMGVDRDISLIEMTGASYHFDQITTARAVPALARAKSNGLNITAGTSIHHLTLNEFDVAEYRTFFKLKPPLRSEDDRLAIIDALKDGTIDIISSMHTPQDEESKRLPFEEAASGAVGLETLLPAALRLYHGGLLDLPSLFRAMSLNPAKRLGLPAGRLEVGAPADLVLFDPDAPFVLNRFGLLSKSKNTPFDEARMQGKVLRTFVNGNEVYQR